MKAYKHLVKHAISLGFTVSVWDGEEWQVKKSTNQSDIFSAIESVDEAELKFRNPKELQSMGFDDNRVEKFTTKSVGWALVSAFGLDDDETVIDHNCYNGDVASEKFKWMDDWSDLYESTL